jgi:hypothetical protein
MRDLVKVLKGGNKVSSESKKDVKTIKELNAVIKSLTSDIKKGSVVRKKDSKATSKAQKAMSKRFGNIASDFDILGASTGKLDKGVNDVTSSLLKFAGATGIVAGVIGITAGTLDAIISNYVAALQAGFSFSDQLKKVRDDLGFLGLNVQSLTELLGSTGFEIRRLGKTSFESITNFIELTRATRELSQDFGFFGMTAGETMEELSKQLGALRQSGLTDGALMLATRDSFMLLNKEVLGYARLTGRQRRDLMREGIVQESSIVKSVLRDIGGGAVTSAISMQAAMEAMTGGGDLLKMTMNRMAADFTGMAHLISVEQYGMEQMYPLIGKAVKDIASVLMDPQATNEQRAIVQAGMSGALQDSMNILGENARRFAGTDIGDMASMLYEASLQAVGFSRDPAEILAASNKALTDAEKNLLTLNSAINQMQQTFLAQFFKIFGLDNIEDGISQEQLDTVLTNMQLAGDYMSQFVNWIINMFKDLDLLNQKVVGTDMGPRAAMMAAELFGGKILLGAIGKGVGLAIGAALAIQVAGPIGAAISGMFTASGFGTIAAAFTTGIGVLFAPATVTALVAAALGKVVYDAINDEELAGAGYNKAQAVGIAGVETAIDMADLIVNIPAHVWNTLNPWDDFDVNLADMSSDYRDYMVKMGNAMKDKPWQSYFPGAGVDPLPATNGMTTPTVDRAPAYGSMVPSSAQTGDDLKTATENYLAAIEETNRLISEGNAIAAGSKRAIVEAVENN